jgi:alanine dehydrogenase
LVKTAANSALAARYLARPDSTTLLMMGAGALAPYLIEAHATVRPIDRVLVWNRTPAKAEALAARMEQKGLRASATTDPPAAAAKADIVSCATFADRPILQGAWLRPGTHVDLVGSYTPASREADDEVFRRAAWVVVDARFSTIEVSGDLIGPIEAGVLDPAAVADMTEVANGRCRARTAPEEITVFKSGGGGHEDLAAAQVIYRLAVRDSP